MFLDDAAANVEAAQTAGWHAVLHESTPRSIAELERIIATGALRPSGGPCLVTAPA